MSVPLIRDDVIASRLTDAPDHTICGRDLEKVPLRAADRDRRMFGELAETPRCEVNLGPPCSSATREGTHVNGHRDFTGRLERALHPRTHVRHVIAGEVHAAVGLAERLERFMSCSRFRPP
jgi:hypothetical protein